MDISRKVTAWAASGIWLFCAGTALAQSESVEARLQALEIRGVAELNALTSLENDIMALPEGEERAALAARFEALEGAAFASITPRPRPATIEEGSVSEEDLPDETALLERALASYESGDTAQAAARLTAFRAAYPESAAYGEASYYLGLAEKSRGRTREAAQAFLDYLTASPQGDRAPEATLELGNALAGIGKNEAACASFNALRNRFAEAPEAQAAAALQSELGC
ncbi:tetratricopeptide repeat protein [Paracoccaceae bacterium GXU_MW_L88]